MEYSAASHVAKACQKLCKAGEAEKRYMDCVGVEFKVGGEMLKPGFEDCAIFGWKEVDR